MALTPFLTNDDGSLPNIPSLPAQGLEALAYNAVDKSSRALLVKGVGGGTPGVPSTTNVVTTQGIGYRGTATITRGANQTPYTAGDVVGGPLAIINAGPPNGFVDLLGLVLTLNITAIPSGMTSFDLHFYNASPPSGIADNGVFTYGAADRGVHIGRITNIVPILLGTGTTTPEAELEYFLGRFKLLNSTTLFAYLVTLGGFTPAANSETYSLVTKGAGA